MKDYNSKRIGNIGEAKVLCKFVELGIPIFVPFGDNEKSDLIADFNGKLNRIQVKTSCKQESHKISFSLRSGTIRNKNNYFHTYNAQEIDYFALYNLESDILLLVPIFEVEGMKQVTFSIPYKASHNQYKTLNYLDFSFEKIINK